MNYSFLSKFQHNILKLAIPNILTNLTVPLLGLVDLGLMGHMPSASYIGALALGSMIFNLLYSGLFFLRMGTTGFTAQSYGARNFRQCVNWLGRGILLALVISVFLIVLQQPIEWLVFKIIKGSDVVELLAADYFRIRIWAAPATLCVFVFSGWFLGMQNARIPLIIALVVNVVNMLVSYYLVAVAGMAIQGVAMGTVIAQYAGLAVALLFYFLAYRRVSLLLHWKRVADIAKWKKYIEVNRDILIRSILITGSFFWFNAVSATLGDHILSINSVLLQFLWIFSYFIDGFAFAAESLTGRYKGARDLFALKKLIRWMLIWGLLLSMLVSLLYVFLGDRLIALLTNNATLISQIKPYMIWVYCIPLVSFMAFVWDGIFIGATASKPMRNMMLVSVFFVFLPALYMFESFWQNHGLWLALCLFLLARGVGLFMVHKKAVFQLP
ncbi:MAG TPA: MATE family efflux transporter [Bacteroidales bacterium]|nr:MATE family efflux transporter [Bacteroidales bacterium]